VTLSDIVAERERWRELVAASMFRQLHNCYKSRRPGLRSSWHSRLRQAEVQNQVRRAQFLLCWTRCLEQSSASPSPNQWHRSF